MDFTATWCGPCKIMAPIFEQLSERYAESITFLKVDVDACQDIARDVGIRSMPTFIMFAKGERREQMLGADPSALEFLLKKYENFQPTFLGTGHKLSDEPSASTYSPPKEAPKPAAYAIDDSKPTTTIQIRTSDGARLIAKFNTTSTIGDLRSHIRSANPKGPAVFSIMAGAPTPQPITFGDATTIQDAGLEGSVVIQQA